MKVQKNKLYIVGINNNKDYYSRDIKNVK